MSTRLYKSKSSQFILKENEVTYVQCFKSCVQNAEIIKELRMRRSSAKLSGLVKFATIVTTKVAIFMYATKKVISKI